eukprot:scaffold128367_cov31-Tisochrysis_lutea.AAC.2
MRAASPSVRGDCRSTGASAGSPKTPVGSLRGSKKGSRGEERIGVRAGGSSSIVMPRSSLRPPTPDAVAEREDSRPCNCAKSDGDREVATCASIRTSRLTDSNSAAAAQPPSSSSSALEAPRPPSVTSIPISAYSANSSARAVRHSSCPVAALAGAESCSSYRPPFASAIAKPSSVVPSAGTYPCPAETRRSSVKLPLRTLATIFGGSPPPGGAGMSSFTTSLSTYPAPPSIKRTERQRPVGRTSARAAAGRPFLLGGRSILIAMGAEPSPSISLGRLIAATRPLSASPSNALIASTGCRSPSSME